MLALRPRLAALVVLGAVTSAHAQFENPWSNSYGHHFNNPGSAYLDAMFWNRVNQNLMLRSMLVSKGVPKEKVRAMTDQQVLAALGGAKKAAEAAKPAPSAVPASRFKPSGQRLFLNELAAGLSKDPAQQKALRTVFETGINAYNAENAKEGLANDVAGGLTFLLGVSLLVLQDGAAPDDDGLLVLARQLQQAMDTPDLKRASDADKQKTFELLVGLGSFLFATWQQAAEAHDDAGKAAAKTLAASFLKEFLKLEPSKVHITATGLTVSN